MSSARSGRTKSDLSLKLSNRVAGFVQSHVPDFFGTSTVNDDDFVCYHGKLTTQHTNQSGYGYNNNEQPIAREMFQLAPFVSPTARDLGGNCLSLRAIAADIESWRAKSLETYQEEVCLVLRLKVTLMFMNNDNHSVKYRAKYHVCRT